MTYRSRLSKPESVILRQVRAVIEAEGGLTIRLPPSIYSTKGLPDLLVLVKGRVFFVEIKRPGGKLTREQEKFKEIVERYGGEYIVLSDYISAWDWIKKIKGGD